MFADQFGWEEWVKEVAKIYNSLPTEERRRTAIYANIYGEAGAVNCRGSRFKLSPVWPRVKRWR